MKAIMGLIRRKALAGGLAVFLGLTAFEGAGLAANWLIIHKDGVQTVYVDKDSIKRTPESTNAWIKGEVNSIATEKDKSVAAYESYYNLNCKAGKYRVTETTFHYTDKSKETTRMADAPWKGTTDRVYFLFEYLCDQAK